MNIISELDLDVKTIFSSDKYLVKVRKYRDSIQVAFIVVSKPDNIETYFFHDTQSDQGIV